MVVYIVQKTVNALIRNDLISEEQKEDYSYAMICIVETVVGMAVILLISILFGKFPETACFLIVSSFCAEEREVSICRHMLRALLAHWGCMDVLSV